MIIHKPVISGGFMTLSGIDQVELLFSHRVVGIFAN